MPIWWLSAGHSASMLGGFGGLGKVLPVQIPYSDILHCSAPAQLSDGSKNELILGASWATQSKSAELQDELQMCEPHLNLFRSRLRKALAASEGACNVSGVFMDVERELA